VANDELTFEDLLQELTASLGGEQGVTVGELAERTMHTMVWVRVRLGRLAKQGRLVRGVGRRMCLDGIERPVPVYRLRREP